MESLESYEVSRQGKKSDRLKAKKDYDVSGSMAESHAQGSALASDEND
jgi:hypothetical protein